MVSNLNATITKSCDTPGVTASAFPGTCTALLDGALTTCLDTQVECRVCQIINEMDGLFVNCDLFDNGVADLTCESGTGPTPTPTPTATTTPSVTPTPTLSATPTPSATPTFQPGVILKGSLTKTAGRFNYNLTLGLPGANDACNTNFPGTHACTYAELQSAEAAGDLDGLIDTGEPDGHRLLGDRSGGGQADTTMPRRRRLPVSGGICPAGHNWEYGTAHTPSRGQRVPLNNGTGALGALVTGLQCNAIGNQSWVGCCQ